MKVKTDDVEIDGATNMQAYGEWVRFKDCDGTAIKIPVYLIRRLHDFAVANKDAFYPEAWEE
jgi:hypothetical protein